MKKSLSLAVLSAMLFASCTTPFKKANDGSGAEYKVVVNKDGKKAVAGDYYQLDITMKYKDSVVFSTREMSNPRFVPYDTAQLPPFFKDIHEGDSLVMRIATDTLFKKNQAAPYMKKGQFVYQFFKVSKIFKNKEEAEKAAKTFDAAALVAEYKKGVESVEKKLVENADQMKKDDAIIAEYLSKNGLQATKTKWGTYVVITTPGTGPALTENDIAEVNYTGRNLKDSVFDSNTDPRFQHVQTYPVKLNQFSVIAGWLDGLKGMQKGTVGKLIIPSTLAYGKQGKGGNIGENEILLFDIAVVNVLNEEQYLAKQEAMEKEMQQMQQKAMEERMKNVKKEKAATDSAKAK